MIKNVIYEQFRNENIHLREVLLRSSGMIDQAEIHIEIDGDQSISDVEVISLEIQNIITSKFPSIERISVIPHSYKNANSSIPSRTNILKNIKLKKPLRYSYRMDKSQNKQ
jgi:divalent metal cation (Fe/Co/Zn/Cd) transporter